MSLPIFILQVSLVGLLTAQGSGPSLQTTKTEETASLQTRSGRVIFTSVEIGDGKDFQHQVVLDGKPLCTSNLIPEPVYLDLGAAEGDTILVKESGGDHCRYRIIFLAHAKEPLLTPTFGNGAEAALSAGPGYLRLVFPSVRPAQKGLVATFSKGKLEFKPSKPR